MRFYRAEVHIGGNRNHVVVRTKMPAPELKVLMHIHGHIAVQEVQEEPNSGLDRTPKSEVIEQLERRYGRVRIGDGDDRRPALRVAFPTWPHVPDMPGTAKEAGVPETQMFGAKPQDQALRERILQEANDAAEATLKEQREEFARQEAKLQEDREAFEQEKADFAAQKGASAEKDDASAGGTAPAQKAAGKKGKGKGTTAEQKDDFLE